MEDNFDKLLDEVLDDLLTLSGEELLAQARLPENKYVFNELAEFEAIFFGGYSSLTKKITKVISANYETQSIPSNSTRSNVYDIDEMEYACAA